MPVEEGGRDKGVQGDSSVVECARTRRDELNNLADERRQQRQHPQAARFRHY